MATNLTYTRQQWAQDFLCSIGNCSPTPQTLNWVTNWTTAETAGPSNYASYNLLNTTQPMPGSTFFNHLSGGLGVQNYTSYQQGIQANATTLQNGYYPDLLSALQSNNYTALSTGSGNIVQEMGTWGTGWKSWLASTPSSSYTSQQFQLASSGTSGLYNTQQSATSGSSAGGNPSLGQTGPWPWNWGADVVAFIQQLMFVLFGVILITVGVVVIFFANKNKQQS